MKFTYKDKDYELVELTEPNRIETFDIIAILEVKYCIWINNDFMEVSKEVYNASFDRQEKYSMVDYFYGSDYEDEELISIAKERLDEVDKDGSKSN